MTAKEAISEIKHGVYRNTDNFEMRMSKECYKAIIAALEKQIPKNVTTETESDREFEDFLCPHCKVILQQRYKQAKQAILYKHKFCSDCGQALDWSDNE